MKLEQATRLESNPEDTTCDALPVPIILLVPGPWNTQWVRKNVMNSLKREWKYRIYNNDDNDNEGVALAVPIPFTEGISHLPMLQMDVKG